MNSSVFCLLVLLLCCCLSVSVCAQASENETTSLGNETTSLGPFPFGPFPINPTPAPEQVFVIGIVAKTPDDAFYGLGDPNRFAINGKAVENISLTVGHTYTFVAGNLPPDYACYVSNSVVGAGAGALSPHISGTDMMTWTVQLQPELFLSRANRSRSQATDLLFLGPLGLMNLTSFRSSFQSLESYSERLNSSIYRSASVAATLRANMIRRMNESESEREIESMESLDSLDLSASSLNLTLSTNISSSDANETALEIKEELLLKIHLRLNNTSISSRSSRGSRASPLIGVVYLQAIGRPNVGVPIEIYAQ